MTPTAPPPRVAPGTRREIGVVAAGITRALGKATGSTPPNLFTTLAKHRGVFIPWLRFASKLMPGGTLPRVETELVILRVADRMSCTYEWEHHVRLASEAGVSAVDIERIQDHSTTEGWPAATALMLRASDELGAQGEITDATWTALRATHSEADLIELCLLVGHYEMLAKTINTLRIEPDAAPTRPVPAIIRRIEAQLSKKSTRRTP